MKLILLGLLSLSAFASPLYEFKNFTKVNDRTYDNVVSKKDISIVVFNNGYCPLPDSQFDCFPFEVKLEYLSPRIIGNYKSIQILNIDTQRNYVQRRYSFKRYPAVLFLLKGGEVSRIDEYRGANDLIQKTFDVLDRFQSRI
jgi:hypothetical protein